MSKTSPHSVIALAEYVDSLGPDVVRAEGWRTLSLSNLRADAARKLIVLANAAALDIELEDGTQTSIDPDGTLQSELEPYRVVVQKPDAEAGLGRVISAAGFRDLLPQAQRFDRIHYARAKIALNTNLFRIAPWGDTDAPQPAERTKSPQQIVRQSAGGPPAAEDIRPWLSKELSETAFQDPAIAAWTSIAAKELLRAIAGEIEADGRLVFRGATKLVLDAPDPAARDELGLLGFNGLMAAAAWVYEVPREVEARHTLLMAELCRSPRDRADPAALMKDSISPALEGAKLAYQLSLEEISKDTLKALADIRKSLSDETAKLADISRQLSASVAGAIFLGLGLLAARSATDAPSWLLRSLAALTLVYVGAVLASGLSFTAMQRRIREEWRRRLYRFISPSDYKAMVLDRAREAERSFYITAGLGFTVAFAVLAWVFYAAGSPRPSGELNARQDVERRSGGASPVDGSAVTTAPTTPKTD